LCSATDDSDDFLLTTLRTCRLTNLADRGLDGTLGTLSDGQKQVREMTLLREK
jgi:hypothetical protein